MRLVLIAAIALTCQTVAHATEAAALKFAQASQAEPAAQPAPAAAAPAPAAVAPAPQAAPTAAAPDATQPTAKASKPAAKKRVARRRTWEADEAKARSIAAKYGVSW